MSNNDGAGEAELVLAFTRVFDAPPELVFKMWSDVEHLVRWYGPNGHGLITCDQDFREGGTWRRCMSKGPGHSHWIHGVYREIRAFERLSFTYINDVDGFEMLVEMDFRDLGGRTEMRFRQSPFLNVTERDAHGWGWGSSFDLLDAYLRRLAGTAGVPIGRPRGDGVAEDIVAARERAAQRARGVTSDAGSAAEGRDG